MTSARSCFLPMGYRTVPINAYCI